MPLSNIKTGIREGKCYVGYANLSAVCFICGLVVTYCNFLGLGNLWIGVHE